MTILIVEDEPDLSDVLSYILRRAGHDVLVAFDGESALQVWRDRSPELVLLDIGLPRKNGWEVCRIIRNESATPIIIVSGSDTEDEMVRGFDLGATDYVTKPFSPRILQARIRTVLRRVGQTEAPNTAGDALVIGDLVLDARLRNVSCGDKSVSLTRLEFKVLQNLALSSGQIVSHSELIEHVWGYQGEANSNVVKGHIRSIRLKLTEIGCESRIRVVPSVGYSLDVQRLPR